MNGRGDERQPTTRDWIAIFGAILGAFMAVLDIQITNASLRYIQGGIGASLDEGSWNSTAYLVAEIITIPLTPWLADVFFDKALPDRQLRVVPDFLDVVRAVDESDDDGRLPRRAGLYRRRLYPDRDDDRIAPPAEIEAADRSRAVRCDRDLRSRDRTDRRRVADRHLFLALDLLHQSAAGLVLIWAVWYGLD